MAKKTKSKKKAAPKKAKAKKVKAKKAAKKKSAPKKKAAKKKKAVAKKKAAPKKKAVKKTVKKAAAKKKAAPKKKAVTKKAAPKKTAASKLPKVMETAGTASHNSSASTEAFKKHVTSLKEGDPAPFFEGVDQNGNRITSLDFPGKNIVLFFYPEDDTETCTIEACNLRDEYKYLSDNNYAVVGVSPDSVESHGKFADKYSLPYPLIADTDHKIINAFDVWGPKQLFGRIYDGLLRTTFIIGFEGNIRKIITNVEAANHARQITS